MNAEKHYRYIVVEDEKLICRNTIKTIILSGYDDFGYAQSAIPASKPANTA